MRKRVRDKIKELKRLPARIQELRERLARLNGLGVPFHQADAAEADRISREILRLCTAHRDKPQLRPLYEQARRLFHAASAAAWPPRFWEDLRRLRSGDAAALETAVAFLEADPWFFRSGYAKESLIRFLCRLELAQEHVARLRRVVLAAVDGRHRREFRSYCRLARKVDGPEVRSELVRRLGHDDARVRRHARWVFAALGGPVRLEKAMPTPAEGPVGKDEAFLQAILAAPDDDAPRLVYADWLEEHGQPERAEFIRLQCAMERLSVDDLRHRELETRERALLERHEQEWAAPLRGRVEGWEFRRGFVEQVVFYRKPSPAEVAALRRFAPVREVIVVTGRRRAGDRIGQSDAGPGTRPALVPPPGPGVH
jgi:uncharacterized protein (TIGR02996 family)